MFFSYSSWWSSVSEHWRSCFIDLFSEKKKNQNIECEHARKCNRDTHPHRSLKKERCLHVPTQKRRCLQGEGGRGGGKPRRAVH